MRAGHELHRLTSSARGLHHTYGNVKEWTETLAVLERTKPEVGKALIRGKGWDSPDHSAEIVFNLEHFEKISVDFSPLSLGFRCAKSLP